MSAATLESDATKRKLSQSDQAHQRLKQMIISGELPPSESLDANRLGDALGLGRTPVREALLRLQLEGIVRIMPKRGVEIVRLSASDIREIYQVISAIETEAVRLLTRTRPSSAVLEPLAEATAQMIAAAEADKREQWVLADESFHRAILLINPNQRLCDVGMMHRDLAQRAHFVALRLLQSDQVLQSARRHGRLIRLIGAGDEQAAMQAHQRHRDYGANMLVGVLNKFGLSEL